MPMCLKLIARALDTLIGMTCTECGVTVRCILDDWSHFGKWIHSIRLGYSFYTVEACLISSTS
jgi:hypothetical protein